MDQSSSLIPPPPGTQPQVLPEGQTAPEVAENNSCTTNGTGDSVIDNKTEVQQNSSADNQKCSEPPKQNDVSSEKGAEVNAPTTKPLQAPKKAPTPSADHVETSDEQDTNKLDVAELTSQLMDIINQEETEDDVTQTGLMKKNVELQEFMVKLIELLREKTHLSSNLERQNTALSNQARSLRDVIAITKDLLNIRNMEVEHLHVDMTAMEKCIKEERERNNLAVQRLSEAMTLNDKLKTEYLTQMELFGKLREKYNEKVMMLTKENQHLKEILKEKNATEQFAAPLVSSAEEPVVSATSDIIVNNSDPVGETNEVS